MRPPGPVVLGIEALIHECGPMTRAELCDALEASKTSVAAVLSRMRRASPAYPKRVFICDYVRDHEGRREYLRAVFDLGDKPDAKRPRATPRATVQRRYRDRMRGRALTSVFAL